MSTSGSVFEAFVIRDQVPGGRGATWPPANRADTGRHLDFLRRGPGARVATQHRHEREPPFGQVRRGAICRTNLANGTPYTRASGGGRKRACGSGFSSTCLRIQISNTSSSMRRWSGSISMALAQKGDSKSPIHGFVPTPTTVLRAKATASTAPARPPSDQRCGQFPIALAAPSVPYPLRFRALALFGRRPPERVVGIVAAGVRKPAHRTSAGAEL
jgi:hypothetical protein